MGKRKRSVGDINASSMADIAFLLLIFFLVTTTMNVDTGLPRMLPPMPKANEEVDQDVNERNVLLVRINQSDKLLVGGTPLDISDLRQKTRDFLTNPSNDPKLSEHKVKNIPLIGDYPVSAGVISLQNHRSTTYKTYLLVQNELVAAYNELRDELSKQKFGKIFDKLTEDQQKAVQTAIPQRISEAEPVENK